MRGELLRYDSASRRRESFLGGVSGHYVDTSADGRWMAFITYPEDELWKSRPDGSQRIRLIDPARWQPLHGGHPTAVLFRSWASTPESPAQPPPRLGGGSRRGDPRSTGARERLLGRLLATGRGGAGVLSPGQPLARPSDAGPADPAGSAPAGAEKLSYPKCSAQGHLFAWASSTERYHVLWRGAREWEPLEIPALAYPSWTRDGTAVVGLDMRARAWNGSTSRPGGGRLWST